MRYAVCVFHVWLANRHCPKLLTPRDLTSWTHTPAIRTMQGTKALHFTSRSTRDALQTDDRVARLLRIHLKIQYPSSSSRDATHRYDHTPFHTVYIYTVPRTPARTHTCAHARAVAVAAVLRDTSSSSHYCNGSSASRRQHQARLQRWWCCCLGSCCRPTTAAGAADGRAARRGQQQRGRRRRRHRLPVQHGTGAAATATLHCLGRGVACMVCVAMHAQWACWMRTSSNLQPRQGWGAGLGLHHTRLQDELPDPVGFSAAQHGARVAAGEAACSLSWEGYKVRCPACASAPTHTLGGGGAVCVAMPQASRTAATVKEIHGSSAGVRACMQRTESDELYHAVWSMATGVRVVRLPFACYVLGTNDGLKADPSSILHPDMVRGIGWREIRQRSASCNLPGGIYTGCQQHPPCRVSRPRRRQHPIIACKPILHMTRLLLTRRKPACRACRCRG